MGVLALQRLNFTIVKLNTLYCVDVPRPSLPAFSTLKSPSQRSEFSETVVPKDSTALHHIRNDSSPSMPERAPPTQFQIEPRPSSHQAILPGFHDANGKFDKYVAFTEFERRPLTFFSMPPLSRTSRSLSSNPPARFTTPFLGEKVTRVVQGCTKLEIESFENGNDLSKTVHRAKFEELVTQALSQVLANAGPNGLHPIRRSLELDQVSLSNHSF